jgi:hypothetical protein
MSKATRRTWRKQQEKTARERAAVAEARKARLKVEPGDMVRALAAVGKRGQR